MDRRVNRRHFLKAATAASGTLAYAGTLADPIERASGSGAPPKITDRGFRPIADYPIQPKRFSDVVLEDAFWKPKVALNASVTIPFEVQKLAATPRRTHRQRARGGDPLAEDTSRSGVAGARRCSGCGAARARGACATATTASRSAVALYHTTGNRELLDRAIADRRRACTRTSSRNDPPFSGGERDAINCVQLYRATHDKKHLDLAKHYLDIRGLENSVNRSRHNQSYKPVLEQSEAVGHAVNCVSLMVSLADVGVLTGLADTSTPPSACGPTPSTRKMYVTGGVGTTGNEGFGEPYALPNISAYSRDVRGADVHHAEPPAVPRHRRQPSTST